tara:strand:- start:204 stop:338 length:135 start_codon:yes stop_codon:yes gene_type:complete
LNKSIGIGKKYLKRIGNCLKRIGKIFEKSWKGAVTTFVKMLPES